MGPDVRKYIEGENVVNAYHIVYVEITSNDDEKIKMLGLCLKSTEIFGIPHELNITVTSEDNVKYISCICSCKAGLSGRCKHCVALLIFLVR